MIDKSWREKAKVIESPNGGVIMCSADEMEKIIEELLEKQKQEILVDLNIKDFQVFYC